MPKIAAPESARSHNIHRRTRQAAALLLAASIMVAAACARPKGSHNITPTSAGSPTAGASKKPTANTPKIPGPNQKHDSKHLLQCLDGNLPLPKGTGNGKNLSLDINKQGSLTTKTLSATGRKALQAASVEVHDEIGGGSRVIGSGVMVDGMIFTAAHVVEDRTIDHITFLLNGERYQKIGLHKINGGCYIYQHNGKQAKLDLHSLDPQFTITDDVAVLIPKEPVQGLHLADTPPSRGDTLYSGGVKYPQDQHDWELISAIATEDRTTKSDAIALTSGKKPDSFDYGDSGSLIVNDNAEVVGIGDSSVMQTAMYLGINYGADTASSLQEVHYTSLDVLKAAAETVGQ